MEFASSDKITVLLNLLDDQRDAIERREHREQQWFEWSTSLLLAAFAAVVALSGRIPNSDLSIPIKLLATILITVPTFLIIPRILHQSKRSAKNAEIVERIQQLLHLFEDGYYGTHSPYPREWVGALARARLNRKTPIYYAAILTLMDVCVVAAIWLIL